MPHVFGLKSTGLFGVKYWATSLGIRRTSLCVMGLGGMVVLGDCGLKGTALHGLGYWANSSGVWGASLCFVRLGKLLVLGGFGLTSTGFPFLGSWAISTPSKNLETALGFLDSGGMVLLRAIDLETAFTSFVSGSRMCLS